MAVVNKFWKNVKIYFCFRCVLFSVRWTSGWRCCCDGASWSQPFVDVSEAARFMRNVTPPMMVVWQQEYWWKCSLNFSLIFVSVILLPRLQQSKMYSDHGNYWLIKRKKFCCYCWQYILCFWWSVEKQSSGLLSSTIYITTLRLCVWLPLKRAYYWCG